MDTQLQAVLVGGTSNIGKSTLAQHLAERLGGGSVSTDSLARYPGRPWAVAPRTVPPHVVAHYLALGDAGLVAGQIAHYQNMWPIVEALIRKHAEGPAADPLVLEGSGIWPDRVVTLRYSNVAAVWLTGSPELIAARIRAESRYDEADAQGRHMIDRFVVRSVGYDRQMMESVRRLGLQYIEVTPETTLPWLADESLARMRPLARLVSG